MPCLPFQIGSSTGFICVSASVTKIMRGVWMEWHDYLGPMFWRDKDCTKPIMDWASSPRIVEELNKWYATTKGNK